MTTFLLRNGPPFCLKVSYLTLKASNWQKVIQNGAGIHSRLTSSDTGLPTGCVESESKSGISSYWTVRKGGPEAQKQDIAIETKQRVNNIPGPIDRVIPCRGLTSLFEKPKAHTA